MSQDNNWGKDGMTAGNTSPKPLCQGNLRTNPTYPPFSIGRDKNRHLHRFFVNQARIACGFNLIHSLDRCCMRRIDNKPGICL